MKLIKLSVLLISLMTLFGCASYYKAPANQPTALMHFKANTNAVRITAYEDESCKTGPHGVRLAYLDSRYDMHKKYAVPRRVIANKKMIVTLAKIPLPYDNWYCHVTLSFTPQENAEYLAIFRNKEGGCAANILRKSDGKLLPVPDKKVLKKGCYSKND